MMTNVINYVTGDATAPQGEDPRIIAHVVNDAGGWGRGFVVALSRRWPEPERAYRAWYRDRAASDFGLGGVQLVQVGPELWVANMVGQHGWRRSSTGPAPVRYKAIGTALASLADQAVKLGAAVHMPRIGCGLAGGEWARIEPLIIAAMCERGVDVTVYDPG